MLTPVNAENSVTLLGSNQPFVAVLAPKTAEIHCTAKDLA